MPILEFAKIIRAGNSLLPQNTLVRGHLIWHSSFCDEPYDPRKNEDYCQEFDQAQNLLDKMAEDERKKMEEEKEKQIKVLQQKIFDLLKKHCAWREPFENSLIELDGKFSWTLGAERTKLGYGVGFKNGAVRAVRYDPNESCPVFEEKIDLRPALNAPLNQLVEAVQGGTLKMSEVVVVGELSRILPRLSLTCAQRDCSNFRTGCPSTDLVLVFK